MSKKSRSLDVDEDLPFQRKEWLAQRIGMGLLTAFVLAAAFGLTGGGGRLSHGEAGRAGDPVFVEFERFVRRGAPATVRIHLDGGPGTMRFWVSGPYFEHVRVESVVPEPETVTLEQNRHVYTIQTTSSEAIITLEVMHQTMGTVDAAIGLVDGPSVQFSQLAWF